MDERDCFVPVYSPGLRMNDHTLIRADGTWHCFHIWLEHRELDRVIGHATSPDLRTWKRRDDILPKDPPPSWESDRGANAPHAIRHESTTYLFYSRYREGVQQIGVATSSDLVAWEKHPGNPIFHPSPGWCPWEEGNVRQPYRPRCCRDPHVMRIDGVFVMYYVAMTREPYLCAVAACTSGDLIHWVDRGPVYVAPVIEDTGQAMMESPCVVRANGRWHLFYTHGRGEHHAVSDDPFDFTNAKFFCSAHASEVFQDEQGDWLISNVCKKPGRSHLKVTENTDEAVSLDLSLARVELVGDTPKLRPL